MASKSHQERVASICFGLDRETDERSLAIFLELFARPALQKVLIPRLSETEITALVDSLTQLMGRHLDETEYHQLFLGENGSSSVHS